MPCPSPSFQPPMPSPLQRPSAHAYPARVARNPATSNPTPHPKLAYNPLRSAPKPERFRRQSGRRPPSQVVTNARSHPVKTEIAGAVVQRAKLAEALSAADASATLRASLNSSTVPLGASPLWCRPPRPKVSLFRKLFRGRADVWPRLWHAPKPARKATRRSAATNGEPASASSLKKVAAPVYTRIGYR